MMQYTMGLYGTIWDHTGAYGTIRDREGPCRTIGDHTGPYGTVWDHSGLFHARVEKSVTHRLTHSQVRSLEGHVPLKISSEASKPLHGPQKF